MFYLLLVDSYYREHLWTRWVGGCGPHRVVWLWGDQGSPLDVEGEPQSSSEVLCSVLNLVILCMYRVLKNILQLLSIATSPNDKYI